MVELATEFNEYLPMMRELNEAFMPFIYTHLFGGPSVRKGNRVRNTKMVDGSPAIALAVLAAGLMNGITSPARKWVNIVPPQTDQYSDPQLSQDERRDLIRKEILRALATSNFYEAVAVSWFDVAGLGTSLILCYEDYERVLKFVQCPPGSYFLGTDEENRVDTIGRKFYMKLKQLVARFGLDALPESMQRKYKEGKVASLNTPYLVNHLIGKNDAEGGGNAPWRERYWLDGKAGEGPAFLASSPLYEWPGMVFRWDCPDGSTYGIPPTLAVQGKAVQLQFNELKTDQGLDKTVSPPVIADYQLRNRPKAFEANGITYASSANANFGARPLMQWQMPFDMLDMRRQKIVGQINEGLFTDLFKMISQLETVRSATEIDARREEKLVQLGPMLQRFYGEALRPLVFRVYGILRRKGVIPPPEDGDEQRGAEVEFSNILSDVQKASDVSTIERFFSFVGQLLPAFPNVQPMVNADDLIRQYAEGLGIRPSGLAPKEEAAAATEAEGAMQQLQQVSEVAKNFGGAAQAAGGLDPGGGLASVLGTL